MVIDAFRLINPNMMVLGQESRQTTSNLGHLQKPSIQVQVLSRLSQQNVSFPIALPLVKVGRSVGQKKKRMNT